MPHRPRSEADFPEGYRPEQELGEGSMGAVWLAFSHQGEGHCAVKVLHLEGRRRSSAERSFNREVRAMARLDHTSVVQILDYGRTERGSPFVAMEYVPGVSLSRYMSGPWSWPALWTLLDGLLAGLAHAHARDLIHRDLKPGNVLIHPELCGAEAVKIADFGIALAVSEAAASNRRIEGTPAYIAPEAASGDVAAVGPWTDLYSLGVMLFELLTGGRPFHGRNLLTHHQRSPVPPIQVRPEVEVPYGFEAIVQRLLAKAPHARFRSPTDVRAALEALGPVPPPVVLGDPPVGRFDDSIAPGTLMHIRPTSGPGGPGLFHLREPPIAGRQAVRDRLEAAVSRAVAGEGPRVVLLEGDAGLGKSRLAAWVRETVEESGRMRALTVRSEPQTRNGGGLRQGVLRFVGAPTAQREDGDKVLAVALPDDDSRRNAMEVLWSDAPHHGPASEVLISHAARLICDLAGDRPLLVLVEDAQWSPEAKVLRLVDRLARPDGHQKLLVVVTLRPSARSTVAKAREKLLSRPSVELIGLSPISPRELVPALEALAPLPPGIADAACMQAAGNPLIALEAVRTFLESEGLSSAPADPNAVLNARIEKATSGEGGGALRSAVARATLLGRSFTLPPLARLAAVPGDPAAPELETGQEALERALEMAVEAGLIIEQGANRWRFSHDLVRGQFRTVCRTLPNWQALNRAAAELKAGRSESDPTGIELEMVARHHYEAGDLETALNLGRRSTRRLFDSGLMGHATSFLRRLLDWDRKGRLLTVQERGELRLMCSEAAEHAGQPDEAEHQARKALEVARRNHLQALAALAASRLGVLRVHADDPREAERWQVDALRFARRSGDHRARCNAHLSLGALYQHLGRLEAAALAYEASLESARTGGLVAEEYEARAAIARIDRLQGRLGPAEATFDEIAQEAAEAGLEVLALTARLNLGLCAWARMDPDAAKLAFTDVRQGARGNLFALELYACLGEAWAEAAEGEWESVEMLLLQAEDLRYDVRLHDVEAARLRTALRNLAKEANRPDILQHLERLDMVLTRTHSTTVGYDSTRG